jgi:hypothetical protein
MDIEGLSVSRWRNCCSSSHSSFKQEQRGSLIPSEFFSNTQFGPSAKLTRAHEAWILGPLVATVDDGVVDAALVVAVDDVVVLLDDALLLAVVVLNSAVLIFVFQFYEAYFFLSTGRIETPPTARTFYILETCAAAHVAVELFLILSWSATRSSSNYHFCDRRYHKWSLVQRGRKPN